MAKKMGLLTAGADVASGTTARADVARGTTARMSHSAEATWQSRGWPTRGAGGAQGVDTWQEATRVHASPRGRPCGAPRGKGVGIWRAHGLVGAGESFGVVTQMR